MNCEYVRKNLDELTAGGLPPQAVAGCRLHMRGCDDCGALVRGTEALAALRARDTGPAPAGLLARLVDEAAAGESRQAATRQFLLGGIAGMVASAAAFTLVLVLGWPGGWAAKGPAAAPAEFVVGVAERRLMDVAIETDRRLEDARISIELYGPIELEGYGSQRHIAWRTNLDAGVNRLSLPVVASDTAGGRMVVRLSHPQSEKVFVVRLNANG